MYVETPTRIIIAPRERCASPHPPPSLSVSFFSIPIVLNTTIRQFTEKPMRPRPTMSVETTNCLSPSRGYRRAFLDHCLPRRRGRLLPDDVPTAPSSTAG